MGMDAFLRACFQMTMRRGSPFARIILMYSESSTSSILEPHDAHVGCHEQPAQGDGRKHDCLPAQSIDASARRQDIEIDGKHQDHQDSHPEDRHGLAQDCHDPGDPVEQGNPGWLLTALPV